MSYRHLAPRVSLGFLVLVGVGLSLDSRPACAADLDPGYAEMPSLPPQQMVTFGSGWYVRGDIAATELTEVQIGRPAPINNVPQQTTQFAITHTHDVGYDASLGGGYAFNNGVRVDLTADFHEPSQYSLSPTWCDSTASNSCRAVGELDRYNALANIYYDFGAVSIVTPYVGAGAGVGFGRVKSTLYNDPAGLYAGNIGYHSFAWALMAGVAIDVYQHVKLDVGYRYLNSGQVFGATLYNHEIRAGLRYMIDN